MKPFLFLLPFLAALPTSGQNTFRVRIRDVISKDSLVGATATIKGTSLGSTSDLKGIVEINNVPNGTQYRFKGIGKVLSAGPLFEKIIAFYKDTEGKYPIKNIVLMKQ